MMHLTYIHWLHTNQLLLWITNYVLESLDVLPKYKLGN